MANDSDSSYTTENGTSYYTLDEMLASYGSEHHLDIFNMYPFTIISIAGLILSAISVYIFFKKEFNIPLYNYLQIYSINNVIMCCVNVFNFTYSTIRINPWANSYGSQFYYSFVYVPIANMNYFYGSVLDSLILLDRISSFDKRFKGCTRLTPYKQCAVALLVCFIVDLPAFAQWEVTSATATIENNVSFTVWFSDNTDFAESEVGMGLIFTVIAIRDVLCLILGIVLNVASIFYLKQHMRKKKKISVGRGETVLFENSVLDNNRQRAQSIFEPSLVKADIKKLSVVSRRMSKRDPISSADLRITVMVIVISFLSACEHLLNLVNLVYPFLYFNLTTFVLYTACNFFGPFRRFVGFFLFIFFNKKFKQAFLKMIGIQTSDF